MGALPEGRDTANAQRTAVDEAHQVARGIAAQYNVITRVDVVHVNEAPRVWVFKRKFDDNTYECWGSKDVQDRDGVFIEIYAAGRGPINIVKNIGPRDVRDRDIVRVMPSLDEALIYLNLRYG